MDALSAFSTLPLRLWSWVGAVVAGLSLLYGVWRVLRALFWGIDLPGFETIVVSITFLGGVQLLSLGVLGGYIGRIFDEVKGRPLTSCAGPTDLPTTTRTGKPPGHGRAGGPPRHPG